MTNLVSTLTVEERTVRELQLKSISPDDGKYSGATTFDQRIKLAQQVFSHTADYESAIDLFMTHQLETARGCYSPK